MKKVLSVLIVACFVLAMLPMSAAAAPGDPSITGIENDLETKVIGVGERLTVLGDLGNAATGSWSIPNLSVSDGIRIRQHDNILSAAFITGRIEGATGTIQLAPNGLGTPATYGPMEVVEAETGNYTITPPDYTEILSSTDATMYKSTLNILPNANGFHLASFFLGLPSDSDVSEIPLALATVSDETGFEVVDSTGMSNYVLRSTGTDGSAAFQPKVENNTIKLEPTGVGDLDAVFIIMQTFLREAAKTDELQSAYNIYTLFPYSGESSAVLTYEGQEEPGAPLAIAAGGEPVELYLADAPTDAVIVSVTTELDRETEGALGYDVTWGGAAPGDISDKKLLITPSAFTALSSTLVVRYLDMSSVINGENPLIYETRLDIMPTSTDFDPTNPASYFSSNTSKHENGEYADQYFVGGPETGGLYWRYDAANDFLGIFADAGASKANRTMGKVNVGKAPWLVDKEKVVDGGKIENVYIDENVVNIGENYFADNGNRNNYPYMETVYLASDKLVFADSAFANNRIREVYSLALYADGMFPTAYVDAGAIGEGAFADCNYLEVFEPTIQGDVGASAFANCTSLLEATVDAGAATEIGDSAFENCAVLGGEDDLFTILEGAKLKTIGAYAFSGTGDLETIDLPDSVNAMGDFAFANSGLTEITFPSGLKDIPAGAFQNCEYLEEVEIPDQIRSIGAQAFEGCAALASVDLDEAARLGTIGDAAFAYTAIDNAVIIPKGVDSIGAEAFVGIGTLNTVEFMGRNAEFDTTAFDGTSRRLVLIGAANAYGTIADAGEAKIPYYVSKDLEKDNGWFQNDRYGYWMFYDGGSLLENQLLDFPFEPVQDSITFLLDASGYSVENQAVLMSEEPDVWSYFDEDGIMVRSVVAADGHYYDENGQRVVDAKVIDKNGNIYVVDANGNLLKNQEYTDDTGTYYLGEDGMAITSQMVDFTDENGNVYTNYYGADAKKVFSQKVDIINADGTVDSYYFGEDGKMVKNSLAQVTETDADGNTVTYTAFFGADGKMVKDAEVAFTAEDGTVTYKRFDADGKMVTGFFATADGNVYYDPVTGDKVFGWIQLTEDPVTWAYTDPATGIQQFGLVEDADGNQFYLDPNTGIMVEGWLQLASGEASAEADTWYFFNYGSGIMQKDTWVKSGDFWYYQQADGTSILGDWMQWNGHWYYCQPISGRMATGWFMVDGDFYYFDPNPTDSAHVYGAMATGWVNDNGNWYYCAANGKCVYGWQEINGNWFYFIPDAMSGRMVTGQYEINGVWQQFAGNGVWQGPVA